MQQHADDHSAEVSGHPCPGTRPNMPATLYLRPNPRAIFLITETHALVFRQPDASESKASRSVVVAEFLPIEEVDVRGLVRLSQGKVVEGVLGVTSVPTGKHLLTDRLRCAKEL